MPMSSVTEANTSTLGKQGEEPVPTTLAVLLRRRRENKKGHFCAPLCA